MRLPMVNDTIVYSDGHLTKVNDRPTSQNFQWLELPGFDFTDIYTILKSPASSFWNTAIANGATARTWGDCYELVHVLLRQSRYDD